MAEAEQLLAVDIEPGYDQIRMSAVRVGATEPEDWPDWADEDGAVSGTGTILVATWSDNNGPVAVTVYRGRPALEGWTHIHTARLIVECCATFGVSGMASLLVSVELVR